jgi:hypothetical protein
MNCGLTVKQIKDRKNRLLHSRPKILFHETSLGSAEKILNSQIMKKGKKGLAGGGIYFADTGADSHRKTENRGIMLNAVVNLGRVKTINPKGDPKITYCKLVKDGFDSVKIPRRKGEEYVVYNSDQVKNIKVSGEQGDLKEPHDKEHKYKKIPYLTSVRSNILYNIPLNLLLKK